MITLGQDLKARAMAEPVAQEKKAMTLPQKIERMQREFEMAQPKGMEAVQLIRDAQTCVRMTPKLAECEHASVLGSLMTCAQLGLRPGVLGQAYLLPLWNGRNRRFEAQLIIGYQGLLELIYRSDRIAMVQARVVHENDEFALEYGLEQDTLIHRPPATGPRGRAVKYYAIARFKGGGYAITEPRTREDMEQFRDKYAMAKKKDGTIVGPWATQFDEMAKKGLAVDTPIPTDAGWSTMGALTVGDIVLDMHGDRTVVVAKSEVKHIGCYRVTLTNGEQIVCDDEHRWVAAIGSNAARDGWDVFEIADLYKAKQSGQSVSMPVAGALDLPTADLPVDPWLLGYWLGDGSEGNAAFTCSTADLAHVQQRITAAGYTIGGVWPDKRSGGRTVQFGVRGGLKKALADLGVLGAKHVPAEYLRGSISQRQALLQGLIDSDGHVEKRRGRVMFDNTNPRLVDAVVELAASLGQVPNRSMRQARGFGRTVECGHVEWQPSIVPATLPRKVERIRPRELRTYRAVKSIERVDSVPTQCIAVDSPTRTYLAGATMVPTHNTMLRELAKTLPKSPEVQRAITHDGAVRQDYSAGGIDARPDYIDGSVEPDVETQGADEPQPADEPPAPVDRDSLEAALQAAFADQAMLDPKEQLEWLANLVTDKVEAIKDLTDAEIENAIAVLSGNSK